MRFTVTLTQHGTTRATFQAKGQEAAADRAYALIYRALEADGALASTLAHTLRQDVNNWEAGMGLSATFTARNGYVVTIARRTRGTRSPFAFAPLIDPGFDALTY